MQRYLRIGGLVLTCLMCISGIFAQDLHFSQFDASPLNHNPALTGIFSGDKRFGANFRRQWFEVPVDYITFSGSYDMKFRRDGARSFWSGGAVFNYDRAGDSKLATAYLGLSGSYTFGFTDGVLLTAGVSLGGGQRSFRTNELEWGNYWDGDIKDPSRGSGEPDFNESKFYADVGAGLNLRLQKHARTRLDVGVGAFHLNQPNSSFYENTGVADTDARLPVRTAIQLYGSLQLASFLDLQANGLYHLSGPFTETVVGGLLNFHISQKKAREIQFGVGASVRLNDAVIPVVVLQYDGFRVGLSYDINTSLFEEATSGRGGPEFSVRYIITDVRPFDQSKLCRIF